MALFTFSPIATQFILTVPITDNDVFEGSKLFSVQVQLLTMNATEVTIDPEQSDVIIIDEDGTFDQNPRLSAEYLKILFDRAIQI